MSSLRHNPSIDPNAPFANDKLGREKHAEILTRIVKAYPDGFVLAINSPWGTGKTMFLKMWEAYLAQPERDIETIYFNAWESDFQQEPLVALLAEMKEKYKNEIDFSEVIEKAGPIAVAASFALIRYFSKKYLGEEFVAAAVDGASTGAERFLEKQLEATQNRKESIEAFCEELTIFLKKHSKNDNPIVFMIDELDRCRPSYAVELLEQVKHLFNVPGIVFVLAIDKEQLGHAIKGVYGSKGINDVEYLRRFIDLEYRLPESNLQELCYYFFDCFEIPRLLMEIKKDVRNNPRYIHELVDFLHALCKTKNISLRGLEKMTAHFSTMIICTGQLPHLHASMFIYLTYLKVMRSEIFQDLRQFKLKTQELIEHLLDAFTTLDSIRNKEHFQYNIIILAILYEKELQGTVVDRMYMLMDGAGTAGNYVVKYDFGQLFDDGHVARKFIMEIEQKDWLSQLSLSALLDPIEFTTR